MDLVVKLVEDHASWVPGRKFGFLVVAQNHHTRQFFEPPGKHIEGDGHEEKEAGGRGRETHPHTRRRWRPAGKSRRRRRTDAGDGRE